MFAVVVIWKFTDLHSAIWCIKIVTTAFSRTLGIISFLHPFTCEHLNSFIHDGEKSSDM